MTYQQRHINMHTSRNAVFRYYVPFPLEPMWAGRDLFVCRELLLGESCGLRGTSRVGLAFRLVHVHHLVLVSHKSCQPRQRKSRCNSTADKEERQLRGRRHLCSHP